MQTEDITPAQAIAIPLKRWLRPHEALFYTQLAKSTFYRKCQEYSIRVNKSGYYDRLEIDLILSGGPTKIETAAKKIKVQ